jgi:hypothetical protein
MRIVRTAVSSFIFSATVVLLPALASASTRSSAWSGQGPTQAAPQTPTQAAAGPAAGAMPAAAKKSAAAVPAKPTKTSFAVALPTAHVGVPYSARVQGVKGLAFPGVTCSAPTPPLPPQMQFDCAALRIVGMPTSTASSPTTITLTDTSGNTVDLKITLPVHALEEVADVSGAKAAAAAPVQAAPAADVKPQPVTLSGAVFEQLQIVVNSQVIEGTVTLTGQVEGLPPNTATLKMSAWRKPAGQQHYLASLKGNATTADLGADGTFSLTLATALQPGETLELQLLPPTGVQVQADAWPGLDLAVSPTIPKPQVQLTVALQEGTTKIAGEALPVATIPPSGSVATQLPNMEVWLHNPQASEDSWVLAQLLNGSATASQLPVNSDGSFSVTLANALSAGEQVKLRVVPQRGHAFQGDPVQDPPLAVETPPLDVDAALSVMTGEVTSTLLAGSTSVSGLATPSITSGATVNVALVDDTEFSGTMLKGCAWLDDLGTMPAEFLPLTSASGATVSYIPTAAGTGVFSATLASPLVDGTRVHVVQIFAAGTQLTQGQLSHCRRPPVFEATSATDWGRIHADFSAGVLISNDSGNSTAGSSTAGSGNFSQAHQFYALTVEKYWMLPGCYLPEGRNDQHRIYCGEKLPKQPIHHVGTGPQPVDPRTEEDRLALEQSSGWRAWAPGISSFFEARLTAIPISTLNTNTTSTTGSGSSSSTTTASSTSVTAGLLTTAQTARVDVGVVLPFLLTRWTYQHTPNALFLAPLAKVGFDTVTGPTTIATTTPSGGAGSQTLEQIYNFWGYGARIGHMELSHSTNRAPETFSYIDILFGPYSNLQSYVCHQTGRNGGPLATSSVCSEYGSNFTLDSRKRLYRLDIEGLLKVPKTLFYVGFNANIGQRTVGASYLDSGYAAPDDLRFFFGTKFDIGSVLSKFKFGTN